MFQNLIVQFSACHLSGGLLLSEVKILRENFKLLTLKIVEVGYKRFQM